MSESSDQIEHFVSVLRRQSPLEFVAAYQRGIKKAWTGRFEFYPLTSGDGWGGAAILDEEEKWPMLVFRIGVAIMSIRDQEPSLPTQDNTEFIGITSVPCNTGDPIVDANPLPWAVHIGLHREYGIGPRPYTEDDARMILNHNLIHVIPVEEVG